MWRANEQTKQAPRNPGSWKQCFFFFEMPSNDAMLCESTMSRKWMYEKPRNNYEQVHKPSISMY